MGGGATVNYTGAGIVLTNIWSNPTLAGDINNDGLVDVADYNIWAANVGKTGANWCQGDLNGDGLVDVADYNIWAANVGKTISHPRTDQHDHPSHRRRLRSPKEKPQLTARPPHRLPFGKSQSQGFLTLGVQAMVWLPGRTTKPSLQVAAN